MLGTSHRCNVITNLVAIHNAQLKKLQGKKRFSSYKDESILTFVQSTESTRKKKEKEKKSKRINHAFYMASTIQRQTVLKKYMISGLQLIMRRWLFVISTRSTSSGIHCLRKLMLVN